MEVAAGAGFGLLAALCLAGTALSVRMATTYARMIDVLFVTLVFNLTIFAGLTVVFVSSPVVNPTVIGAFAMAGLTGTLIGRAFFYTSVSRVGASRAEPIKASMPLHATIFAVVLLGEQVGQLQMIGIVLIVAGVALVSREGAVADREAGIDISKWGLVAAFFAAMFYGIEPIFATVGFDEGASVFVGLTIKTGAATVLVLAYYGAVRSRPHFGDLSRTQLKWLALAGLFNTAFLLTYYGGLSVSRVGIVVPIMQTSPVIVAALSLFLMGKLEVVTPRLLGAASVVVLGAITVTITG